MSKAKGILILGGTGFVGRKLISHLSQSDQEVYVIAGSAHLIPSQQGLHTFSDSLDNIELLNSLLPHIHTVFHLASKSTPGKSASQPSFEVTNNLLPTLRFLETLHRYKNINLIFFSSGGAIYGNPEKSKVTEDTALNPLSYYGAGKAAIEKFIIAFCQQTEHNAIILRPSNLYGPGQPFSKGFGVIPTIFNHIMTGTTLQIWGDGSNVRDYLHIDDMIDLCSYLINSKQRVKGVQVYNIGSNTGLTLNQLCDLSEKITAKKIMRQYQDVRSVDVKSIMLDCSHIQKAYQWSPKIGIEKGLADTWEWFKTNNK